MSITQNNKLKVHPRLLLYNCDLKMNLVSDSGTKAFHFVACNYKNKFTLNTYFVCHVCKCRLHYDDSTSIYEVFICESLQNIL